MNTFSCSKSSFTLPMPEVALIARLKEQLGVRSNTALIRLALDALRTKVDRDALRSEFQRASRLVRKSNAADYAELDALADEGLE